MTHVSLFSGIGGIDLAAEQAGFETIAQVEKDGYATKMLEKHWPGVHRVRDIRDFPDRDYGAVTLVSGGVPCQPASIAGKRRGEDDDRWLWPEMLRVIRAIMPVWVLAENVSGILSLESGMVIESMLIDLEDAEYEVLPPLLIPAAGVGAPHLRYRVFIVAYSSIERERRLSIRQGRSQEKEIDTNGCKQAVADSQKLYEGRLSERETKKKSRFAIGSQDVRNPTSKRLPNWTDGTMEQPQPLTEFERSSGREIERDFCGVAHGIFKRVDRLKCLGNACVPAQVYPILQAIAEIEVNYAST